MLANDRATVDDRLEIAQQPAHGTVTLATDGSFRYSSETGFYGTDEFSYRLVAPNGEVSVGTVTVDVAIVLPGGGVLRNPAADPFAVSTDASAAPDVDLAADVQFATNLEWLVPSVAMTVPGVMLIGVLGAQMAGTLIWLPLIRRFRRGLTVRRLQRGR